MDRRTMHTLTRTAAALGAALITATLISAPAQAEPPPVAGSACPVYVDARTNQYWYSREGDYGLPNGPGGGIHICRNGKWVKW
ncbi:hypothetical protein ABZ260_05230 [Streptosporangium sp. NPDC006013]|uniref:hypothetical protein n=1 Tax=Streptosporangium sp. NPDC006013 TaxID=3155596 RepID=UPI0033B7E324